MISAEVQVKEALGRGLKKHGFSQYQLARLTGVPANHIGLILQGRIKNPRLDTIAKLAAGFGLSVDEFTSDRPHSTVAEPSAHYGEPAARGLLLVEEGVGAGQGRLPIIPESDRPYFFREDWLRARGWTPEKPDRLVCVKLGPTAIADSMYPTIQPESVLVVDRDPERNRIEARSIWLVDLPGEGLLVKRLTVADGVVILESDNPDPEYAPRVIHLTERRTIEKIARGRVLWYATEVA
jgi:transcriptional regulator with XRE-family HTH domain